jgi:hypothetical protein
MSGLSIDRLVRKEVSLGAIRERQPPQDHIGLAQIAPFMDVATDDVIFDYIKGGLQDGLAPARAEDAEAELAQKDEMLYGQGRAAIIDWSLKDKYTASDVTRYREDLLLRQLANGANTDQNFNFVGRTAADFERRVARDDTLRRRKLDNRLEWLIMSSIESGGISYNDGKLMFSVDWGRPSNQTDQVPASGLWDAATNADFDPIGDLLAVQQFMYDTYGFRPKRAITSTKVLNRIWLSTLWQQRAITLVGATLAAGSTPVPVNPNYSMPGFGPQAAVQALTDATGIEFVVYDSVYRTRPIGSTTFTNHRFLSENKMFFLPGPGDLGDIDDTEIGFAKTLTSPHPEGDWTSGYYEWEDETRDPWMRVRGSGIKAFPVFPYMEYTYSLSLF